MPKTAIDRFSFRGLWTGTDGDNPLAPWRFVRQAAEEALVGRNLGGITATLGATDEVQNANLYFGDVLAYDIADLISVEFTVQTVAALAAGSIITVGVASARNNDPDGITALLAVQCVGDNDLIINQTDGVNTNRAIATGETLINAWKRIRFQFRDGVMTQDAPTASVGGLADCRVLMSDPRGRLRRVGANTRIRMDNYALGLQPYIQLQKTGGVVTDSLSVLECEVEYKINN